MLRQLVERVEEALAREGIIIVAALVEAPNEPSLKLFHALGEEAQIEAFIGYDMGSAYPIGPVEVRVAETHAEEARELIAEFLAAPEEDEAS
ncbi:hypothetical protein HRbin07_00273 [bacterium HR07]|nr:hypothetical protein HRbin07_00273 [bacterium HR07]